MKVTQLLRLTAMRYSMAVQTVLDHWVPDCNCHLPGCHPCPQCPFLQKFEALVRDEIRRSSLLDCNSGNLHDPGIDPVSKPPV